MRSRISGLGWEARRQQTGRESISGKVSEHVLTRKWGRRVRKVLAFLSANVTNVSRDTEF